HMPSTPAMSIKASKLVNMAHPKATVVSNPNLKPASTLATLSGDIGNSSGGNQRNAAINSQSCLNRLNKFAINHAIMANADNTLHNYANQALTT
ncbi:MAG: hypothetical protein ACR2IJ_07690, partial [Fluviibacter sp.]